MRNSYSESFKSAVVRQVVVDGQTIQETARTNNVSPISIRKWIKQHENKKTERNINPADYDALKNRLQETIKEREILRATIAILLKEDGKNVQYR